jgi:energy-converting hydrogenase Eha subunit C
MKDKTIITIAMLLIYYGGVLSCITSMYKIDSLMLASTINAISIIIALIGLVIINIIVDKLEK